MDVLSSWLRGIFFPRKCMLCRTFLRENETDLCHKCRAEQEEYPFGEANPAPRGKIALHFLDSFTAVWYYEGNVRKSIHRFKFRRGVHLAPKFGRLMAMQVLRHGPYQFDDLTWVPVSPRRQRRRGYDQCELLAAAVGEELGKAPVPLLQKVRDVPPQSGISQPAARKANVLGAFGMMPGAAVQGRVILLLDDIYTTGATLDECARVLLTAGAKEVHALTIAAVRYRKK